MLTHLIFIIVKSIVFSVLRCLFFNQVYCSQRNSFRIHSGDCIKSIYIFAHPHNLRKVCDISPTAWSILCLEILSFCVSQGALLAKQQQLG